MFKNHVTIAGTLTALSPLHLGTGGVREYDRIRAQTDKGLGEMVEVAAIMRDGAGRPYLPGTSIKGALRARTPGPACVFGLVDDKRDGEGVMGRLWIYGAAHQADGPLTDLPYAALGGDAPVHAFAAARTRIDRATGTAGDHKLFHAEMVPAGTTFSFYAKWLTDLTGPELEEELAAVKATLAPLVAEEGVTLGRGGRQGQGRMRLSGVTATLVPLDGAEETLTGWEALTAPAPQGETVRLTLTGDGPYVSLDSSKRQRGGKVNEDDPEANVLHPLKSAEDTPALTGPALLGALRARAAWLDRGDDNRNKVYKLGDKLSATERLFGVTGWRGLLAVEDIRVIKAGTLQTFTSVKLDRFSSAPIDGALFSVKAFVDPVFEVALRLALRNEKPAPEDAQDLFVRLLEDIKAMGLMLGHGGARGFGWFGVTEINEPEPASPAPAPINPDPAPIIYEKLKAPEAREQVNDPPTGATYRFVPLNETVVPSEFPVIVQCNDKDLPDSPSPLKYRDEQRLTGRLTVKWTAETPFLFGQPGAQKLVPSDATGESGETILESARLGDDYVIPGATLRGAMRALVEILSFSRLRSDTINGRHRFGLRDFNHNAYKPVLTPGAVKAGWLYLAAGGWRIDEVRWLPLSIDSLLEIIRPIDDEWFDEASHEITIDKEKWREMKIEDRYECFNKVGLNIVFKEIKLPQRNRHGVSYNKIVAQIQKKHGKKGVLVFSGQEKKKGERTKDTPKRYEYILEPPAQHSASHTLTADEVEAFKAAHCKPEGGIAWRPDGSWAYWEPKFMRGERIPVFFIEDATTDKIEDGGDKKTQRQQIRFGLTRLFKLPHLAGVAEVLARSAKGVHKERPKDKDQQTRLDMAEALFGFIDEGLQPAEQIALKSRVSFGFARCDGKTAEIKAAAPVRAVLMTPRPSFSPYYLAHGDGKEHKDKPLDYSNPHSVLNGRKRYPARNKVNSAFLPFDAADAKKTSVESVLRFLPAGLSFRGEIAYRNLSKVELGALLWALTLGGGDNGKYRHMLGHARSMGYGQFKADIVDCGEVDIKECIQAFNEHMSEKLGTSLSESKEVMALLKMCDPTFGERHMNLLKTPGGPKTYQTLRNISTEAGKNVLAPYDDAQSPSSLRKNPARR